MYTKEELDEEKAKIWSLHVELGMKHEDKIKDTILDLVERVGWPSFYLEFSKLALNFPHYSFSTNVDNSK